MAQALAQQRPARPLADAEDRAQDYLQRQLLHPWPKRVGLPERPALDLLTRDFAHQLAVALHARPVERGQHQLALREMALVVEQQHRVGAEYRQQDAVCLTRVQQPRVAGEHLLDRRRIGGDHPGAFVGDLQREEIAETRLAGLEHPLCPAHPISMKSLGDFFRR